MAQKCINCGRGIGVGHAVSHAKNRVRRIFKPNLQKLKVLKDGIEVRVKFCTRCIKRIRRDGHLGIYQMIKYIPTAAVRLEIPKPPKEKKEEKVEKAKEALDIAAIVGKPRK